MYPLNNIFYFLFYYFSQIFSIFAYITASYNHGMAALASNETMVNADRE